MRPLSLAAALLCASTAWGRDVSVEAPALSMPARPLTVETVAPLSLPLALTPGVTLPAAPNLAAAPLAAPLAATAQAKAASPQIAAAPALPASALPAAASAGASSAKTQTRGEGGSGGESSGLESDALSGGALFDNALARAEGLSSFSGAGSASAAARRYREAMNAADRAGWEGHGAAVSDAALALLTERGVKALRQNVSLNGLQYEAVTVAPEKGLSPLNDLAYDLKKQLDVSLDLVPERTQSASGAFNAKDKRIMLAALDQPDFYIAALHEARHAWYSSLLRQGQIRLFHLQVVAKRGRAVAPGAEAYSHYVSLEELSTFPKTLKHMLTEMAKLKGDDAKFLRERLGTRALQLAELLKTADFISRQIKGYDRRKELGPRRMSEKELEPTALQPGPGMDYFKEEFSQANLYFTVPRRTRKILGFSLEKASAREARAALRLRAELLGDLTQAMAGPTAEYYQAVRSGDYAAASRAADALIKTVRLAEEAWAARTPDTI